MSIFRSLKDWVTLNERVYEFYMLKDRRVYLYAKQWNEWISLSVAL